MPNCFSLFGVEICIPTAEDIVNALKQYIETEFSGWLEDVLKGLVELFGESISVAVSDIGSVISSSTSALVNGLSMNLSNLISPIHGYLDYLSKYVSSLSNAVSIMSNSFIVFSENIVSLMSGVHSALSELAGSLSSAINNSLSGFTRDLSNMLNALSSNISNALNNAYVSISNVITGAAESIASGMQVINDALSNVNNTLRESFSGIINPLVSVSNSLENMLRMLDPEGAREYLSNLPNSAVPLFESGVNIIMSNEWNLFLLIMRYLSNALKELSNPKSEMTKQIRDLVMTPFIMLSNYIYQSTIDLLEYEPPITVEKSQQAITKYLAVLMSISTTEMMFRLLETIIGLIGDVEVFGSKIPGQVFAVARPFSSMIRSMSFNLGFGWLTWTIWSDVFRSVITTGMQRYYREKYRTRDPTLAMIQEAYRRGLITSDEFKKHVGFLGYGDEWFSIIEATALYYPSPERIQEWLSMRLISEDTARLLLTRYGVLPKYHDYYITTAYRYMTLSYVMEAYYRGLLSDSEAKQYLRFLGYRDEDIDVIIKVNARLLTYSNVFEAYEWGLIDENKMNELLYKLGYRGEELAIMSELGKRRAISDEVSMIRTRLLHQFVFGMIHRSDLERSLISLGIPRDQVDLLIKAFTYDKQLEIVEDYVSAILREFRDGKIDEAQLRILIAPFIRDPQRIEGFIAYQRSLREKKPAYILPPIFTSRRDYLNRMITSLEKQIDYLSKIYTDMMREYVALINLIESELEGYPDEFKAIARMNIEKIRDEMRAREEYYLNLIAQLQFNLYIYQRLLDIL